MSTQDKQLLLHFVQQYSKYAKEREFDVIFLGKESIDFNGSTVPGMVAEHLHMPFVSFATHMELTGDSQATLKREVDGGSETIESSLPVQICVFR